MKKDAMAEMKAKVVELEKTLKEVHDIRKHYKHYNSLVGLPDEILKKHTTVANRNIAYQGEPYDVYYLNFLRREIKRINESIQEAEAIHNTLQCVYTSAHFTWETDLENMKLYVYFETKPEQRVIDLCRRFGFKWSFSNGSWVRHLTANATSNMKQLDMAITAIRGGNNV